MHFIYKLVALSVVFGLVLTNPAPKTTDVLFDDLAYDSWYDMANSVVEYIPDQARIVEVVTPFVPKIGLVPFILSLIPKIVALKVVIINVVIKFIKLAVKLVVKLIKPALKLIKLLGPKAIFLVIGGVAIFGFCKLTSLCGASPAAVVYDVPAVLANPQMEDAQAYLIRAMQQYYRQ